MDAGWRYQMRTCTASRGYSGEELAGKESWLEKYPGASRTPCLSIIQSRKHTASDLKSPPFPIPDPVSGTFSGPISHVHFLFFEGMTGRICHGLGLDRVHKGGRLDSQGPTPFSHPSVLFSSVSLSLSLFFTIMPIRHTSVSPSEGSSSSTSRRPQKDVNPKTTREQFSACGACRMRR